MPPLAPGRSAAALAAIARATATSFGERLFRSLAQHLESLLQMRYVIVAALPADHRELEILAFWDGDRFRDRRTWPLPGSPCASLLASRSLAIPRDARHRFPDDPLVRELEAQAFVGVALIAASGHPIGALVALHDQPSRHPESALSLLTICGGRAAAELERRRTVERLRQQKAALRARLERLEREVAEHQRARDALEQQRRELEARVRERTAALEATNALLRHTLEQRLAVNAEHERLVTAVEAAAEAIVITGADGLIQYVNPAFERLTGYQRSELTGVPARQLGLVLQPADPVRPGETKRGLLHHRRRDGTISTAEVAGAPLLDATGQVISYVTTLADVTERKALEDHLRQAQKMDAIGRLTGGIAHDFNNLLTIIQFNAELVRNSLPPELTHQRSKLESLLDAASRGAEMVRKLLAFARREALHPAPVCLSRLVSDTWAVLQPLLPENIACALNLAPSPLSTFADRSAIEQVLLNLVTNARDAMPTGGSLTIATGRRRIERDDRWYAYLSVQDTGVGMDETVKARACEPFFTTKEPGSGTGLGLAVVYGLVKQHDGFVDIRSTPHQGTTVTVYLPALEQSLEPNQKTHPTKTGLPRGHGECILVVEDEERIRKAARDLLERHDYRVLLAADGTEAMALFEQGLVPDVVVSDLVMPHMGGQELARNLRAKGYRGRILFTTGYDAPPSLTEPFLGKPWTAAEFLETIRRILEEPARFAEAGPPPRPPAQAG